MAEVVKKYDFTSRRSGRLKYPWAQWMNGQIWALKYGEDFTVKPTNFANNAASYGKRRDHIKDVNIAIDSEAGIVYVQAVLLPDGEAVTEE